MSIWKTDPTFFIPYHTELKRGDELYKYQIDHLANALIVDDYDPKVEIDSCDISAPTDLYFPKDALVSGSFIMCMVAKHITRGNSKIAYDDIDIYFKSKQDAMVFASANHNYLSGFNFANELCAYGWLSNPSMNLGKVNLIYGVEYDSPGHLISRYDIRACSMCVDPNDKKLHVVRGSVEDATTKQITFNPVPRGVSIRRLVKYVKKGFDIDKHQNLFFSELIRSDIYKPELELFTKEY